MLQYANGCLFFQALLPFSPDSGVLPLLSGCFHFIDLDNLNLIAWHTSHLLSGLRALFVPSGRKPALSPRIFVVKAKLRRVCLFRSLPSEKVALTAKIL